MTNKSKSKFFVPENANLACRSEELSPSGKYKLVVTPYSTGKGYWGYTQGLVYRVGSDTPIAEIQRNYSSFPFLWIEDHPNKNDYLVAGEDYQGQTVIELTTERRRDFLPKEAKEGHGFCWAEAKFERASSMLVVEGCYWACPYQFQLFDFSDPMRGWPEIGNGEWIDADIRRPVFSTDGTITCYQSESQDEVDDSDGDESHEVPLPPIAATKTFRREDLTLVRVSEWVSDKEKESRAVREEGNRKYNAWLKEFKETDPLYLAMLEGVKDPVFAPADHIGIGITFKDWCPDFHLEEKRITRRIQDREKNKSPFTIDLEWGATTGPIKIQIFKDGNTFESKFFPHSIAGMWEAFTYARGLVTTK